MKAPLFYRIAAVLMWIFAAGHTWGFRRVEPGWHVDSLVQAMQSTHFDADGFQRTYWDFYVGFGLMATALILFGSVVAWQFSELPAEALTKMRLGVWGLVVCFGGVAFLAWRYFFILPIVFSTAIFVCLVIAAWRSGAAD